MFIVILTTNINTIADLISIRPKMDRLIGSERWSIDLDDEDRVIRMFIKQNLLSELLEVLRDTGFTFSVLNIYHSDFGIDYPLISEEPRSPKATFTSWYLSQIFYSD